MILPGAQATRSPFDRYELYFPENINTLLGQRYPRIHAPCLPEILQDHILNFCRASAISDSIGLHTLTRTLQAELEHYYEFLYSNKVMSKRENTTFLEFLDNICILAYTAKVNDTVQLNVLIDIFPKGVSFISKLNVDTFYYSTSLIHTQQ